ncbi:MAG TPA: hypothetical protein VFA32_00235 [Dehalococcoidia bacterium]|jgi:hypothetical protein|nr:hypothetical protein [Dehalococcoidia bacterium]
MRSNFDAGAARAQSPISGIAAPSGGEAMTGDVIALLVLVLVFVACALDSIE